jgi:hypothetical protein
VLDRVPVPEQALAAAEHDREDLEPKLVDQLVLEQGIEDVGAPEQEQVTLAGCSLIVRTALAMSPSSTCEFAHSSLVRVFVTTYLGSAFIRSAKPSSLGAVGQNEAKIW